MNFENDTERDFYTFLISKKGVKAAVAYSWVEKLREFQPFKELTSGCLARTINMLKVLLEYEDANFEKYNCWARATANYTKEELRELHDCMRKD